MKVIVASVHCDRCTKSEEFESDDEELNAGWLIVQYRDKEYDFCDRFCLAEHDFEEE